MATTGRAAARPIQQSLSQSRPVSSWAVLRATIIKDLQVQRRYLPDMIAMIIELALRIGFFFLLSGIISVNGENSRLGRDLAGHDMFIFFQGALLLFIFNSTALNAPVNAITRDLSNGTMEYLYSNPSSRYAYFLGTVMAKALITLVLFVPLYVLLVFSSSSSVANMASIMAVCICTLVTLVAFGVMIGLLGLIWKQVGSVTQILTVFFELLAGAYFPIAAFPIVLQYLAYALPYTWGYDLIRYYSFDGEWQTILPVWIEWLILISFVVIYTIISRILSKKAERLAKRKGLHLL